MSDRLDEIQTRSRAGYLVSFGEGFNDILDTQNMKADIDYLLIEIELLRRDHADGLEVHGVVYDMKADK